jgi:hypothetical protein
MQQLSKRLGIKWSSSTAYHPQTDGQTERINQEIEQYLRTFVNYWQNDWAQWLPIAEFAHNNSVTVTGHSPFKLLYGYNPEILIHPNLNSTNPTADERIDMLKEAQEDAKSTLQLVNERMKKFYDRGVKDTPTFKKGDKVWLNTKNIRQRQLN